MKQYIADELPGETIKGFDKDKFICVKAGTGRGKSYWVMTEIYNVAKANNQKILLVENRRTAERQFNGTINSQDRQDVITVTKYQNIENGSTNTEGYAYIVNDEAHYPVTDCMFNNRTDISFNKIMEQKGKAQLIYMTATDEGIFELIKEHGETVDYDFGDDYSGIQEIIMFTKKDYIENKLKTLEQSGRKALVFLDGLEELIETYAMFKSKSMFVCAESRREYKDLVNESLVEKMTNEAKMQKQFLFATSAMDTGFNLEDDTITDVFCSSPDLYKIVQWVGRVRIQQNQKITVHIRNINKYQVGGRLTSLLDMKERIELLKKDPPEWRDKYGKNFNNIFFHLIRETEQVQINKMAEFRLKKNLEFYSEIVANNNFQQKIEERFGIKVRFKNREDENERIETILIRNLTAKIYGKANTKQFYEELSIKKKYPDGSLKTMTKPNEINQRIDEIGYMVLTGSSRQGTYIEVVKLRRESE